MTLYKVDKESGKVTYLKKDRWHTLPGDFYDTFPPYFAEVAKLEHLGETKKYKYFVTEEP